MRLPNQQSTLLCAFIERPHRGGKHAHSGGPRCSVTNCSERLKPPLCACFLAGALFATDATAVDGFWTKPGGGSWADGNNWDSGDIANGTDDTAYFGLLVNIARAVSYGSVGFGSVSGKPSAEFLLPTLDSVAISSDPTRNPIKSLFLPGTSIVTLRTSGCFHFFGLVKSDRTEVVSKP